MFSGTWTEMTDNKPVPASTRIIKVSTVARSSDSASASSTRPDSAYCVCCVLLTINGDLTAAHRILVLRLREIR